LTPYNLLYPTTYLIVIILTALMSKQL